MTSPRRERTSFVGRTAELAAIRAAFDEGARLVTLHGPPGVGKTRLARAFAARVPDRPVLRVDLSSARTTDDLVRAVARAVSLRSALSGPGPDASDPDALARIAELLARLGSPSAPTLLVLDPLEGLASTAAAILASWVDAVDALEVLVASRERLRVEGELTVAVAPLPRDDAARLFVERARAVRPSLSPDLASDPNVVAIVERLDRLPLAIELSAARASILSPREMRERIEHEGPLGAGATVLRRALQWSFSLLTERERLALAQCSVFVTGFSPASAERVLELGAGPPVLDVLDALVAHALLAARDDAEGTRIEPYETVRAFAAEHLRGMDPGRETELRHARWLAELDRGAPKGHAGIDARDDLARVARERENLLAAFRRMREREDAREEVVGLARVLDPLLVMEGPHALHVEVLEAALAAARALGDGEATIDLLGALGRVHGLRGGHELAEAAHRQALELARTRGDSRRMTSLLSLIAHVVAMTGRIEEARALALEARDLARAAEHPRAEAFAEQTMGIAARAASELDEAVTRFRTAAALARRARADRMLGLALANLGEALFARGDLDDAAAANAESRATFEAIGDRLHAARIARTEIAILRARGDLDRAAERLEHARANAAALADPVTEAFLLSAEASVALARGDVPTARYARDGARAIADRVGDRLLAAEVDALDAALRGTTAPVPDVVPRLAVADEIGAFRVGAGPVVDLSRRGTLRRVLGALLARRRDSPGAGLDVSALFEAAWPGERAQPSSASARVYMAVRALRALGLSRAIETREDGYRIDPRVLVERLEPRGN